MAFDRPEPTFRHERIETYKANRSAAPDILRQQIGLVRQVIETLRIPILEVAGFEADDVIATIATRARDDERPVIVVTGDRDSYQLVEDPLVKVLYNRRGVSDYALYDEAGIEERTGVRPDRYVQYAALRGDTSDNLPGVPGVGEKTAAKLINTYGDLDGVFANLESQTPKLRASLAEHEENVRLNALVMELVRDVPLDVELEDLLPSATSTTTSSAASSTSWSSARCSSGSRRPWPCCRQAPAPTDATDALDPLLDRRGRSPSRAVRPARRELGSAGATGGRDRRSPWPAAGRAGASGTRSKASPSSPTGTGPRWPGCPLASWEPRPWRPRCGRLTGPVGAPGSRPVVGHGLKGLVRALLAGGIDVRSLALDTRLAAYLLDPAEGRYVLGELLPRFTRFELPEGDEAPSGQLDFGGTGDQAAARRAATEALGAAHLAERAAGGARGARPRRAQPATSRCRSSACWPAWSTSASAVDRAELERLNAEMGAEAAALTRQICEDAGREFNVNSTLQLRQVLYEELGLAPQKKTKTGYSTDAATLEKLAGQHAIIDHLLRYREVEKLRSTYGDGLLSEVGPDRRIHATFNQTVARTGRLSSEEPNLHNIPVRSEMGRAFRKAFVAAPGEQLCIADYNQIELRCIAHLADDPGLVEAFRERRDIHHTTAERIFGVEDGRVTVEQRSKAKMVSYGLAYGMEAYGLGQRLNIPTEEAAEILDAYFTAFPAVRDYMDRTVIEARKKGYTETLMGRRRYIPELTSSNFRIRQAGERQAMNAGIQGLAADIFKVALVRLDRALEERGAASRLVLQVHDEVILEVPDAEHDLDGRARARDHGGRVPARRAARGQPLLRAELGRRQGLTASRARGELVGPGPGGTPLDPARGWFCSRSRRRILPGPSSWPRWGTGTLSAGRGRRRSRPTGCGERPRTTGRSRSRRGGKAERCRIGTGRAPARSGSRRSERARRWAAASAWASPSSGCCCWSTPRSPGPRSTGRPHARSTRSRPTRRPCPTTTIPPDDATPPDDAAPPTTRPRPTTRRPRRRRRRPADDTAATGDTVDDDTARRPRWRPG